MIRAHRGPDGPIPLPWMVAASSYARHKDDAMRYAMETARLVRDGAEHVPLPTNDREEYLLALYCPMVGPDCGRVYRGAQG